MTVAGKDAIPRDHQTDNIMTSNSLYISLNKEHRVSRSFRASWFLKMLSQDVDPSQIIQSDTYSEDFGLLSAVGTSLVSPSTLAFYICQQYSLVFIVDMSTNMVSVSNSTYSVKVDDAISSLCACLQLLTQPFHVQGSTVMLEPLLCVTVMAYYGHATNKPINVLLQGVYLNKTNCNSLVEQLKIDLKLYENSLAGDAAGECPGESIHRLAVEPGDTSLEGMVKAGTLAIQLLPRSALKGLVMLTDGISGFSSPATMHSTVNGMRGANISCWVVQVGGTTTPTDSLGLIPDIETLQFIARACNGAVMAPNKILSALSAVSDESHTPNTVQEAILFWTFQQSALDARVRGVISEDWVGHDDQFAPITHRVFFRGSVSAPLLCVVGCKIREGFFLKDVDIKESVIEVILYYPWQPSVNIYYTITAPWPVTEKRATLQVVTSYDGPYSFVLDIQSELSAMVSSTYRIAAIRKFKQTLQKFSSSDVMLAHFLSFAATPTYHTLPQSIQDGIPMFYLPLNKSKPVPSIDISSPAGDGLSALFQFWRPLCTIDTSQWFRWFHSDKIVLVLHQDSALPRNLLQPSSNGRYASVQCRVAALQLFEFLKTWSSVILLENHSFIRFLPSTDSPQYFCLVRVAQKHPCVVLHIGHIEGTPHSLQMATVRSLRVSLKELSTITACERSLASRKRSMAVVKGKSCATMIDKQLQRVMIRYDAPPGGSGSTPSLSITDPMGDRLTQMDYFHDTRWQWFLPRHNPVVLNSLLRRRLREGYKMTSTKNGMVTLAVQLTMKQPGGATNLKLLLQYVIFPFMEPLSSELWVEPQYGTVCEVPPELEYLIGCTHDQIRSKVQEADLQLLTRVGSFLHLLHSCREQEGYLSPAPPTQPAANDNGVYLLDSESALSVEVPFHLSSLFSCSRAVTFELDVFSEVTTEDYLSLVKCSHLNQDFWNDLTERIRRASTTEVSFVDCDSLVHRLSTSSSPEARALSETFESRSPTLWKCFSLAAEDNSVTMIFVAKFFISRTTSDGDGGMADVSGSGEGVSPEEDGPPREFMLPVVVMQCSQSHVIDVDPARPDVPPLQPDGHAHLVVGETHHVPDLGGLNFLSEQLTLIHRFSFLHTLHMALLQNASGVFPQDFYAALNVCSQTVLSVDVTPLVAGLCSHSVTKMADDSSSLSEGSAPLSTDILCEVLTAVLSKKTGTCLVSLKGADACKEEGEEEDGLDSSKCDLLSSEIDQALSKYLSEVGFFAVPQCPAHFWLNERVGGVATAPSEVSGDAATEDGPGSVDTCKDRGWSESSAGTTSVGKDTGYSGDSPHAALKKQPDPSPSSGLGSSAQMPLPDSTLLPSSPLSTTDTVTLSKMSFDDQLSTHTPVERSDVEDVHESGASSSSEFGFDFYPLLSPPNVEEEVENKGSASQWPLPPLFLKLMCRVSSEERGRDVLLTTVEGLPRCLRKLTEGCHDDEEKVGSFTVSVELVFLSFSSEDTLPVTMATAPNNDLRERMAPSLKADGLSLSLLPSSYHSTANSLKTRLEWLVSDELVSAACEATPITTPLLQTVAAHVQATHRMSVSCFVAHIPLRFVFGSNHSKDHFLEELERMDVPSTYSLNMIDEYCYIKPKKPLPQKHDSGSDLRGSALDIDTLQTSMDLTDEREDIRVKVQAKAYQDSGQGDRSKTPPPVPVLPQSRYHRRSLSSGFPRGHVSVRYTPTLDIPSQPPSTFSSQLSLSRADVNNGYEASESCSISSVSEASRKVKVGERIDDNVKGFWLVLRILPQKVELYFQLQSSREGSENVLTKLQQLCEQVKSSVAKTCHQTNQWFLLRDMLETRKCSPYLMSESASDAWVNTVVKQDDKTSQPVVFDAEEFRCELMWKTHVTPHWRLKALKTQAALKITRTALNMFAVANRRDMYVLQDVKQSGEETIFYLKIDESLCRVDSEEEGVASQLEDSITAVVRAPGERCETRATMEDAETMSTYSLQHSISEFQPPELERQLTGSSFDLTPFQPGKPQESIVLQLYGITKPTPELKERLHFMIQSKLDDAVLDMMCSLYARNQQLKLHPADVQFLQPSHSHNIPTHVLCIPIPNWVYQAGALFYYLLQCLTSLCLKPQYFSSDERDHFHVPERLHNAYLVLREDTFKDSLQDHVFLYVRPQTKGRGMAAISVTLNDSRDNVVVPQMGVLPPENFAYPLEFDSDVRLEDQLDCTVIEDSHCLRVEHSVQLQIWEKGNIGLSEFSAQLSTCFKQALFDYLMEFYLLPQPVARPLPQSFDGREFSVSPFILVDIDSPGCLTPAEPPSNLSSRRESEELKTTSPSYDASSPAVRKISTGSRRSSDDRLSISKRPSLEREDSISAKRSRGYTEQIIVEMEEAVQSIEEEGGSPGWIEKEKRRRKMEARDAVMHDAHLGNSGVIDESYHTAIPQHLAAACRLHSACVKHHAFPLVGNYSARVFISQTVLALQELCPDFTVNAFRGIGGNPLGPFVHFVPEKDWTKVKKSSCLVEARFVAVGRNISQWEESCDPLTPDKRILQPWLGPASKLPLQLFQPLDSKKLSREVATPLQGLAASSDVFVPRQRVAIAVVTNRKAEVWLYNLSEEVNIKVKNRLERIAEWQSARAGLLHHLLAQKMGLFQHTQGRDIQQCTKLASKQCRTMADVAHLVKLNTPTQEIAPSRAQLMTRPLHPAISETINIENFYQEAPPPTPPQQTADDVYNHGQQFRDCHFHRYHQAEGRGLLGRVFTSWQSARLSDSSGPVYSTTISSLKRTARLLHYCTSPLLVLECVATSESPVHTQQQARPRSGSKEGGASREGGAGLTAAWIEKIKEELLQVYISYLKTLGFQAINERTGSASSSSRLQRQGSRSHQASRPPPQPSIAAQIQPSSLRLYKCLQRSWQGGIMLIELLFQEAKFMVKLYTLEQSRLGTQTTVRPEIQGLFSAECARFKDFIHVHSFMYDFHLRILLDLLNQKRQLPRGMTIDVRKYMELIYKHNKPLPNFVRNLLSKGSTSVPSPMKSIDLYRHLLAHSNTSGTQTIELKVGDLVTSELPPEAIGLLINVSPQSLGPTTTPELSKIIEETQANYFIRILAVYKPKDTGEDGNILKLVFYLLMVHKEDTFPRLTCNSPQLRASCHAHPTSSAGGRSATPTDNETEEAESELNMKVRAHRRKLGFGSLSAGSNASRIVLDTSLISEQIRGVQTHLETTIRNALYLLKRDELWKRLLYGREKNTQDINKPVVVSFEILSYEEFRELLRLVSISPLDQLDPRLTALRRQTKKWYKRLLGPLEVRFAENIRMFNSPDGNVKYAAIINPDWQDMFVLIQCNQDSRGHQGFSAVYRKHQEGRDPKQERLITANVEADQQHIETIVNFACSFMWASILDTTPPQPHINLL